MSSQDQLRDRLRELAQCFREDPEPVRKTLTELLVADPSGFRAAALEVLAGVSDPSPRKSLLELMLKAGLLPACDPALIGLEDELELTRDLFELDPLLDMKLARRLSGGSSENAPVDVIQRVLILLNSLPENTRVLPLVVKLLRHPHPHVRSKAALVIGRVSKTPQVMGEFLSESDPRIRANAIEALWGMDSAKARVVLREAAEDANNRVVGNALLGLYRLGETAAIPRILRMAAHPKAEFRTTAAWIMEQTGSPRFLPVLAQMVRESDPRARAWVFRAITKLKRTASGAVGLARLRAHLTGASLPVAGKRTVWAAIAAEDGREIPRLPATSIVLWEDSRAVPDYSVRALERPEHMALGLVLPKGESGDRAFASLCALKRNHDCWQEFWYSGVSMAGALEGAFAFLETAAMDRRIVIVAPPAEGDQSETGQSASLLARARSAEISARIIPASPEDPGKTATACEKAYLMLLCGYEIASQGVADPADHVELKLEVYSGRGYGSDVLQPSVSGWRSAPLI